jgi:hypothetical protein
MRDDRVACCPKRSYKLEKRPGSAPSPACAYCLKSKERKDSSVTFSKVSDSAKCPNFYAACATGLKSKIGLAAEFRSEKIPRNRLGTASVIPRKKVLIPRHSEVYRRVSSEAQNGMKKISFTKNPAPANRIDSMFSSETCFETEFRVVVSSAEWFRT